MTLMPIESVFKGRTFDDFLFRPQYSPLISRKDADLRSQVCRGISVNVPIVGANMDTVTRERMAKTLALEGCVGILDRGSVSDQVDRVKFVKRQHSYIIENPLVLPRTFTIGQARDLMTKHDVSGILVEGVQGCGTLAGILTHRDMLAADDDLSAHIDKYMTHLDRLTWVQPGISMDEAEGLMLEKRIEKLPIATKPGRKIQGLITLRDLRLAKQKPYSVKDPKGRLVVGAAIGARGDYLERAEALIKADVDFIVVDIAHAHSIVVEKAIPKFRKKFKDFPFVCGNVATYEGATFLMGLGVGGIKVGIGPGRGCLTRLETGAGVPQLHAIREVRLACKGDVPIIADGGARKDKDIVLALLNGADTVMLGSMFAGTDETPGEKIDIGGKKFKLYRGMTSPEAVLVGMGEDETAAEVLSTPAEGKELKVEYVGSVVDIIERIRGHLRSAVSYAGEKSLSEARRKFCQNPELFIQLSEASRKESFDR